MASKALQPRCWTGAYSLVRWSFDTTLTQLGEIALDSREPCLGLHRHWHHAVASDQSDIPDFAPPVDILVAVRIFYKVIARYLTDLRRAGKVLMPVSGPHFPLAVGEAEIVKRDAIKNGNGQGAGAWLGKGALYNTGRAATRRHRVSAQFSPRPRRLFLRRTELRRDFLRVVYQIIRGFSSDALREDHLARSDGRETSGRHPGVLGDGNAVPAAVC